MKTRTQNSAALLQTAYPFPERQKALCRGVHRKGVDKGSGIAKGAASASVPRRSTRGLKAVSADGTAKPPVDQFDDVGSDTASATVPLRISAIKTFAKGSSIGKGAASAPFTRRSPRELKAASADVTAKTSESRIDIIGSGTCSGPSCNLRSFAVVLDNWFFMPSTSIARGLGFKISGKLVSHPHHGSDKLGQCWNSTEVVLFKNNNEVQTMSGLYRLQGRIAVTGFTLLREIHLKHLLNSRILPFQHEVAHAFRQTSGMLLSFTQIPSRDEDSHKESGSKKQVKVCGKSAGADTVCRPPLFMHI